MITVKIGINGPIQDINLGGKIHTIDLMIDLGNGYPFNGSFYVQTDDIHEALRSVSGFVEKNMPKCASNGGRSKIECVT